MKAFNMIENLSVVFLEDENNHKTLNGLPWDWGNFYLLTFYEYLYLANLCFVFRCSSLFDCGLLWYLHLSHLYN